MDTHDNPRAPAIKEGETLLSVAQAGERLGLSRAQTWRMVYSGELQSIFIGSRRLIPSSWVDRYIEARVAAVA